MLLTKVAPFRCPGFTSLVLHFSWGNETVIKKNSQKVTVSSKLGKTFALFYPVSTKEYFGQKISGVYEHFNRKQQARLKIDALGRVGGIFHVDTHKVRTACQDSRKCEEWARGAYPLILLSPVYRFS